MVGISCCWLWGDEAIEEGGVFGLGWGDAEFMQDADEAF